MVIKLGLWSLLFVCAVSPKIGRQFSKKRTETLTNLFLTCFHTGFLHPCFGVGFDFFIIYHKIMNFLLNIQAPPFLIDMTLVIWQMNLCSCKRFRRVVPITKNYIFLCLDKSKVRDVNQSNSKLVQCTAVWQKE